MPNSPIQADSAGVLRGAEARQTTGQLHLRLEATQRVAHPGCVGCHSGASFGPALIFPDREDRGVNAEFPSSKCLRVLLSAGALAFAVLLVPAMSQTRDEIAHRIESQLMAPCCWSEPVSQHLSPAAEEIRREIRALLAAGKSEQEILEIYVSRYGERILTMPRAHGFNVLLYIMPWVFAVAGILGLGLIIKRWLSLRPTGLTMPAISDRDAGRIEGELHDLE